MNVPFSHHLKSLRIAAKLTNDELARLAKVPESLISGLQNDNRRVGEYQARKIGTALQLTGEALEAFIYAAIDGCTQKVLREAQPYPAALLNLLAMQLHRAGFDSDSIHHMTVVGNEHKRDINLTFGDGQRATLNTQLVISSSLRP